VKHACNPSTLDRGKAFRTHILSYPDSQTLSQTNKQRKKKKKKKKRREKKRKEKKRKEKKRKEKKRKEKKDCVRC
jgi:hypothetical protein